MNYALGFIAAIIISYAYLAIINFIKMPVEVAIIFLIFIMWTELNIRISEVKQ